MYPTLALHKNYSLEDILSRKELTEEARVFLLVAYFMYWIFPMYKENSNKTKEKVVKKNYEVFVTNLIDLFDERIKR